MGHTEYLFVVVCQGQQANNLILCVQEKVEYAIVKILGVESKKGGVVGVGRV